MHKRTSHVNSDTTPIAQMTVLGQAYYAYFWSQTLYTGMFTIRQCCVYFCLTWYYKITVDKQSWLCTEYGINKPLSFYWDVNT